MDLGAVAVYEGNVVGFIQLSTPEFQDLYGLHTCEAGEMYIDQLGVSSSARGKGIGTRLLKWSEERARSTDGIDRLTLSVINGNRAIGLYKRFGFRVQPHPDCIEDCCDCCFVFWLFGCPYGIRNPTYGSTFMVKNLL